MKKDYGLEIYTKKVSLLHAQVREYLEMDFSESHELVKTISFNLGDLQYRILNSAEKKWEHTINL